MDSDFIVTKKTIETVHYLVKASDQELAAERLLDEKSGPFTSLSSHTDVYVYALLRSKEGEDLCSPG